MFRLRSIRVGTDAEPVIHRLLKPGPYAAFHIVIVTAGVTLAYATGAFAPALLATVSAGLLVHTVEQIRQSRSSSTTCTPRTAIASVSCSERHARAGSRSRSSTAS